jgi:phosphoglycerate dehydrogenase-like enzyme
MGQAKRRPRIALAFRAPLQEKIFTAGAFERLSAVGDVVRFEGAEGPTADEVRAVIAGADAVVSSWGTPPLTAEVLEAAPDLKLVVHSAGSVKPIVTDAVWERGIIVTSCAAAIAHGVAEYTFAAIVMGTKRAWEMRELVREGGWVSPQLRAKARELAETTIGIVGAGTVGRRLLEMLRMFDVTALLYDPTVSADEARALGAEKVDLDDLCRRADVLTLHAPSVPATERMIDAERLAMLRDGALVVNTARGSLVDEKALVAELESGRLVAVIDVTTPEPPAADSPLRTLPNVFLTPHIAGAVSGNRRRQGNLAATEIETFFRSGTVKHRVTKDMLDRLA